MLLSLGALAICSLEGLLDALRLKQVSHTATGQVMLVTTIILVEVEIPTIDNETSQISLNTTTANNLNSYNNSWNKWLLNTNNKSITFKVNSGKWL